MASPRPVPPWRRVILLSTWWKGWKSSAWFSSLIPIPLSLTWNRISGPSSASNRSTNNSTCPTAVNLMAFDKKLLITCAIRLGSPWIRGGRLGLIRENNSRCLFAAEGLLICRHSSTKDFNSISWGTNSNRSWSILEKSKISLIIAKRFCPETNTALAKSVCSWSSRVESKSSVMPKIPLSGVRTSWLMVAIKAAFASAAASAAFFSLTNCLCFSAKACWVLLR